MLSAFDPTLLGIQYAVCRKGIMRDSSYPGKGENACGAPPQTALVTRGRGVRKPIDRLLWPLALGAWTYATGSPTPKGLGSSSEHPAALTCLSGFRHPRAVRTRPASILTGWPYAIRET